MNRYRFLDYTVHYLSRKSGFYMLEVRSYRGMRSRKAHRAIQKTTTLRLVLYPTQRNISLCLNMDIQPKSLSNSDTGEDVLSYPEYTSTQVVQCVLEAPCWNLSQ